jgi:hypothetical protein
MKNFVRDNFQIVHSDSKYMNKFSDTITKPTNENVAIHV